MTNDRKRPGQATRAFNRFAGRVAGKRAMPVWALVHHVGRTSGKSYATPVAVFPAPGAFYVALPWGRGTDWVRNLRAAGGRGELRLGRRVEAFAATELEDAGIVDALDDAARTLGFAPQAQTLEVHGLCAKCAGAG